MNIKIAIFRFVKLILLYLLSYTPAHGVVYEYDQAGRAETIKFSESNVIDFNFDESSSIISLVLELEPTAPTTVSWNIAPSIAEADENFLLQTRWIHDSAFIVKTRLRYRLMGSENWQVAIMDYVSGTPDVGANFELSKSFSEAGQYELQFASDASETASPNGVSSNWLPNDPLVITVLEPEPVDSDLDSVFDDLDNCPAIKNADQADNDQDRIGDVCDPDDDNDGLLDSIEIALGTNPLLEDTDGDGIDDLNEVVDTQSPADTDNDGKIDAVESSTTDSDNDGTFDQFDPVDDIQKASEDILDLLQPVIIAAIKNRGEILLETTDEIVKLKQTDFDSTENTYTFDTLLEDYKKFTVTLKRLTGDAEFKIIDSEESYVCPPSLQTSKRQVCAIESPARKTWQIKVFSADGESRYELKVLAKK